MFCLGRPFNMNQFVVDFFDTLADRWDELCTHDSDKLNYLLQRTGLRKGLRILDIGCGTGVLEEFLLPYSPIQIVGVDFSPKMIQKAQSKYRTPLVDFRCMDVHDIRDEIFDYIIAYSVFPHFFNPKKTIAHLANLLVSGGEFVICHSEGRDRINGLHTKQANKLSKNLPSVVDLIKLLSPYFTIQTAEDNENLYLVRAIRR